MKKWWFLLLSMLLVACANSGAIETAVEQTVATQTPVVETIEETVVVEMPVTVEVLVTQEVIQELEVTREVMVEVEVTRIVEQIVTATPAPTEPPTATPTTAPTYTPASQVAPQPTAPPVASVAEQLLTAMQTARDQMLSFGGMIDQAIGQGFIDCQEVVNVYDAIAAAPTFNVAGTSQTTQFGYGAYRQAIDVFANGTWDMTQNCRDFLVNPSGGSIPFQQWGAARQAVNNATDILSPAISSMEAGG